MIGRSADRNVEIVELSRRIQQAVRESRRRRGDARCTLQFLPAAQYATDDASNGCKGDGNALEHRNDHRCGNPLTEREVDLSDLLFRLGENPVMNLIRIVAPVIAIICSFFNISDAPACTGITITPKDGSIIFGRTLEFATDLKSNVIVVPRGKQYIGSTPTGEPGLHWKNEYGVVGINAFNLPITLDGLNEKGLHVGLFYFPGFAKYQTIGPEDDKRALAPWELGIFVLGTCSNVDEAVTAAKSVRVGEDVQPDLGIVPPAHFVVTDAKGNCVVLEHINGELKVYKNPLGIMSNSPSFDWHLTNLSNYVNMTVNNIPQIQLNGREVQGLGQGTGMLGLPGDFTPPSRFVRAAAFTNSALPVDTAREGVLQTFHILNQFDIPKGAARGIDDGHEVADYTLWTSAADLTNLRFYFRTYRDSRLRMVALNTVDFDAKDIKTISMQGEEQIENMSQLAQ